MSVVYLILRKLLLLLSGGKKKARLLIVCRVLSRGWKDRQGADRQSRRDCMPCDAHGQEDGRPLRGRVQWCRQTLYACGHGETQDIPVLFFSICSSQSLFLFYSFCTGFIKTHLCVLVMVFFCCFGFVVGRWSLPHRPSTLPAELSLYGESFRSGQKVWITCE